MATFVYGETTLAFSVEHDGGMLPYPSRSDADVRRYRCRAIVHDLTTVALFAGAVSFATYERSLGTQDWVAVIEAGDRGVLTVPIAGQGEPGVTSQELVNGQAILTRVEGRGSAQSADRYRLDLEFALPDVVS